MTDADMPVPPALHRYFWDYDCSRLRTGSHRNTILLRLMESGDVDAWAWARNHYGDAVLRRFLVERRGRGLSFKRLRYWELILGIPAPEVDAWIGALRVQPWYARTAR